LRKEEIKKVKNELLGLVWKAAGCYAGSSTVSIECSKGE
jgi:hypothetical protein